jgi:hypothetical protein
LFLNQERSAFKFGKHALDDGLQLWQVRGCGFPQDLVVDAASETIWIARSVMRRRP